jgi:murein DD-endopeptidase MepM/ murein hydrolase activator NlpD
MELAQMSKMGIRVLPAAAIIASLGGCKVVIERAADSTARSDTTVSLTATPVTPPPESARATVAGGDVADSTGPETTSSDLGTLASELIIPIAGVRPSDLHDTFNEPRGGGARKHEAVDILAPRGTPVLSASAGRVLKLHDSKDGGLMVYAADRSNRFVLMYAHLDHYAEGMRDSIPLKQGQVIGYVGTTGDAPPDTPHLHFAIAHPSNVGLWWTGPAIDPVPLLQQSASP